MRQQRSAAPRKRLLAPVLGLAVICANAQAQTECRPCLGGFRFQPSSIIGDPFALTYFSNSTGGGMALDLTIPVRNIQGEITNTLTGNIGFFLLDFDYQKELAPWLGLRAHFNGAGRVGTSAQAVLASGASAIFGGGLGVTVPFWRNSKFLVSATGDLIRSKQWEIDPYAYAQNLVRAGFTGDSAPGLLRSVPANRWSAGLRGAWGIRPWVGLNAEFESGLIDLEDSDSESLTEFGLQTAFDFAKTGGGGGVPIGVSLGFRGQSGPGRTGEISGSYRIYELGLFYTGRSQFVIGGDFFWSRIAIRQEGFPDMDAVQFRLVSKINF